MFNHFINYLKRIKKAPTAVAIKINFRYKLLLINFTILTPIKKPMTIPGIKIKFKNKQNNTFNYNGALNFNYNKISWMNEIKIGYDVNLKYTIDEKLNAKIYSKLTLDKLNKVDSTINRNYFKITPGIIYNKDKFNVSFESMSIDDAPT